MGKAARRERAAKARAREQKAKQHEKRAKAAERSSKERSGKRERSHKAREDRIFRPLLTTIGAGQYGRQWSGWVNNMDAYFAYSCPNNKAMVGMLSYHHNGYEDRRWRFMCDD